LLLQQQSDVLPIVNPSLLIFLYCPPAVFDFHRRTGPGGRFF
jgi:hypothetical protein